MGLLFIIGPKRVTVCLLEMNYDLWEMLVIGVGVDRVFRNSFEDLC